MLKLIHAVKELNRLEGTSYFVFIHFFASLHPISGHSIRNPHVLCVEQGKTQFQDVINWRQKEWIDSKESNFNRSRKRKTKNIIFELWRHLQWWNVLFLLVDSSAFLAFAIFRHIFCTNLCICISKPFLAPRSLFQICARILYFVFISGLV